MRKIKVAVGLSGGVDSAVAAYLLKKQGFDVSGVYLHCFDDDTPGCRGKQDRQDALSVALHLKIPFQVLDFRRQYKSAVIGYFKKEYLAGRTPNPDVICNRDIKFGLFLDWCIKNGFDYLATGHYAKIVTSDKLQVTSNKSARETNDKLVPCSLLLVPKDTHKDQTYFLWAVPCQKFSRVLFPLADFRKKDVRSLAKFAKIPVAAKSDSTGICFIGEVRVEDFLKQLGVKEKEGEVVIRKIRNPKSEIRNNDQNSNIQNIKQTNVLNLGNSDLEFVSNFDIRYSNLVSDYEVIGSHRGVAFYTIGQRHGFEITRWPVIVSNLSLHKANSNILKNLRISFNRSTEQPTNSKQTIDNRKPITDRPPLYVISKDVRRNRLVVGFGVDCYRDNFQVSDCNWLVSEKDSPLRTVLARTVLCRIRHGGELIPCRLTVNSEQLTTNGDSRFTIHGSRFTVHLRFPQRGIAPGQSAVFYDKTGVVLGGGIIQ